MRAPRLTGSVRLGTAVLRLLGVLLLVGGLGLLAATESGLLAYRQAALRHGGEVLDLGRSIDPPHGAQGRMARVAGMVDVVAPARDEDFNQSARAPVLIRHVEMFQWREIVVGGQPYYELEWVDRPVDSDRFVHPAGHANPGGFRIAGRQFDAGEVRVGGLRLSPALLHALPGSERIAPDPQALPPNLAASFSLADGYLVTSAHPESPRLGDLRVSWEAVPAQEVTLVGRINGDQLVPATDAPDGKGYEVQVGDRPLVDVFPDLPVPPEGVLPRRVLAWLLAALGVLALLWERRQHVSDVLLPVGLAALLVGAVGGAMWLGGSAGVSLRWFGVGVVGLAAAGWPLWRRHGSAG